MNLIPGLFGAAGAVALGAYLDARLHIRNDLRLGDKRSRTARYIEFVAQKYQQNKMLIYNIFEDRVDKPEGDHVFLIFGDRQWTYSEFFRALQPVGNWLRKDLGIKKGEMVALDGGNTPEWVMLWFALEGIGASPAFINNNLTAKPLTHCLELSGTRYLLADRDVAQLISPVEAELANSGIKTRYYSRETLQELHDEDLLPADLRKDIDPAGVSSLIYTSGTTGMPKGTVLSRTRELLLSSNLQEHLHLRPGDRMYTCLPLYHGSAHGLCFLPCIGAGATVVLSRKFSHKTFWPEVHRFQATHIQYVGELCRYLVNAPPSKLDKGHSVRMAWGNGLRPDIWEEFRQRFGIEVVQELYAATDGLGFSTNANRGDFSRDAIAVRGALWHWRNGADEKRVLIDPDTQEVLRGDDGFAVAALPGEAGETIHQVDPANVDAETPAYFNNYEASAKRRLRDVFRKGDMWYRSGDLMRLDKEGRLYFVDRLGDTFRWKSENVSTNEVSDIVGAFPQIAEANVYGVLVPKADGRAGCAAVVLAQGVTSLDFKGLAEHCLKHLPRYAVPIFLRVVRQLEYTGTMKLQKGRLRSEGVNVNTIQKAADEKGEPADPLYWLPPGANGYIPFGFKNLEGLANGSTKL